jgi:hypothetical protein
MSKDFCKKLKICPVTTGNIRRIRCRNRNIRNCYRNKLHLSTPVAEKSLCKTPDENMSALDKLIKARELMLEAESRLIKGKGFCPYELGYALKNLDQIINQITEN